MLVHRRRDIHVRYTTQIAEVEISMMCYAVFPDKTGPVDTKNYRKILYGDIVNYLIESTLQEC